MPYCSSLNDACRFLDVKPGTVSTASAGTVPNTSESGKIWIARHNHIKGTLAQAGITIASGVSAEAVVQTVEAKWTSGHLLAAWESRQGREVPGYAQDLMSQASAQLVRYVRAPSILSALSATYDRTYGATASGYFQDDPADLSSKEEFDDITFTRQIGY